MERRQFCKSKFGSRAFQGHHPGTPKGIPSSALNFECLDAVVSCIRDRFNKPGYTVLKNLEDLLLKAVRNEDRC